MSIKPTINGWYGRLGNNIQQISNAIYYCMKNKINFYCPEHQQIKSFYILFGEDKDISSRFFFYNGPLKDFECDITELNKARRAICLKFIVPNFKDIKNFSISSDTLVIHVRSGDIFRAFEPHYVQNPLSYYNKIIENYKEAIIVCEDEKNPVIPALKKNSKITLFSKSLNEDFSVLLSARNLVSSGVGTFSVAAALCSERIENFYCSNLFLDEHLNPTMLYDSNIKVHMQNLDNYIKIGEWAASKQQLEFMINYEIK